jgi:hypothetical protein
MQIRPKQGEKYPSSMSHTKETYVLFPQNALNTVKYTITLINAQVPYICVALVEELAEALAKVILS